MNNINEIATMRRSVDARKFLSLLRNVGERIENGHDESISIHECNRWGFSGEEAVPYLLLLVQAGVLEQRVQVYDEEDDAFEDYRGQGGLERLSEKQVRLWFKPALTDSDVSSFFVMPPQ